MHPSRKAGRSWGPRGACRRGVQGTSERRKREHRREEEWLGSRSGKGRGREERGPGTTRREGRGREEGSRIMERSTGLPPSVG